MRERSPNDPKRCPWKPRTARAHSGEAEGRPPPTPHPGPVPPERPQSGPWGSQRGAGTHRVPLSFGHDSLYCVRTDTDTAGRQLGTWERAQHLPGRSSGNVRPIANGFESETTS